VWNQGKSFDRQILNKTNEIDHNIMNHQLRSNSNNNNVGQYKSNSSIDSIATDDIENDLNFLKEKHQSDTNFLKQLNNITQTSELKIESVDLSLIKGRASSSRQRHSAFLFSPSHSSSSSDRYSASCTQLLNRSTIANERKQNLMSQITPADKNMELVVGKGRRPSSSSSTKSNSALGLKNTSNVNRITKTKKGNEFSCKNCKKTYETNKDFEIHNLYCNKA
jgi:hypothetical protein